MTDYLDLATIYQANVESAQAEIEELRASIAPRVDELNNYITKNAENISSAIIEEINISGYELFVNVETAAPVYRYGWSHDCSFKDFSKIFLKALNAPYLIGTTWNVLNDYKTAVCAVTVGIPEDFDDAKISELAEILEPVVKVQAEILGYEGPAMINVLEDTLSQYSSYYILYDAEEDIFAVSTSSYGSSYTDYSGSLKDVLTYVGKYLSYC